MKYVWKFVSIFCVITTGFLFCFQVIFLSSAWLSMSEGWVEFDAAWFAERADKVSILQMIVFCVILL